MQSQLKISLGEEYFKILEAVSEVAIIACTDNRGRITYANHNFCKISGYSMDELYRKDHRILNSGLHEKSFFKEMYEFLKSGKTWRGEVCNRKKDGSLYWVDTQIIPIINSVGEIESIASIRFDITEKKLLESARLDMQKLSASIEMAKTVAHEVNNPLTIIDLCCLGLSKELNAVQPSLEVKNKLEKISEQTKRIALKIKQLRSDPKQVSSDSLKLVH